MKWQIWLFVHGNRDHDEVEVVFILHLLFHPAEFNTVTIHYQVMFDDKRIDPKYIKNTHNFEKNDRYIWWDDMMKSKQIINSKNDNPVFTLIMEMIHINNIKDECVDIADHQYFNHDHLVYSPNSKLYQWKLTDFDVNKCEYTTS